jgi:hypothetical protein
MISRFSCQKSNFFKACETDNTNLSRNYRLYRKNHRHPITNHVWQHQASPEQSRRAQSLGMVMHFQQFITIFGIRAYPNNPLYCGRLQSLMPVLSAKNVLTVASTMPSGIFSPAALSSNFSLGLITTQLFG